MMLTAKDSLAHEVPIEFAVDYSVEITDLAGRAAGLCNDVLSPSALSDILGLSLIEARKLWDGVSPPPVWLCGAMLIALHRMTLQGAPNVGPFLCEEVWQAHHRLYLAAPE